MTDLLDIPINEKTHTDSGMGLIELLNTYDKASVSYFTDTAAPNLAYLAQKSKLIHITDSITVDSDSALTTENSIGLVIYDPIGELSNVAIFPRNGSNPFLLNHSSNDAVRMGTGDKYVILESLDELNEVAPYLASQVNDYSFISPLDKRHFNAVVKAYAQHRQVIIFTNYLKQADMAKTFEGHNVRLVTTVDYLPDLLMTTKLDNIMADTDNKTDILGAIEWEKPEPLTDTQAPPTPYPLDAWAGVLLEALRAISHHAQVPHAVAGQAMLGALSTMAQRYINACYADGSPMPISVYVLTQYPSGEGKTLANGYAYQAIRNHQRALDEKHEQLKQEWLKDKASIPRKDLDQFLLDNPEPIQQTLLVSNGTLQGILDNMLIHQQNNITWTTADCGQFFGGYSMMAENKTLLISCLSDIWSVGEFDRMLSPRAKNAIDKKRAYGVRFTVDLAGQNEIIRPAMNDQLMNGQGFLPRFLFAAPDVIHRVYNTPERMADTANDDPRLLAYWQICSGLINPMPNPDPENHNTETANIERITMGFADQKARQALADYQQYAQDRKAKGSELEHYPAYANRLAENASRIAALMAFFDGRKLLTVDDIKRASMLTEYSIKERMRYTETPQGESDIQKLTDWLVKTVGKKQPPVLNRTFIKRNAPNALRNHGKDKRLDILLQELQDIGYILMRKEGKKEQVYINEYLCSS